MSTPIVKNTYNVGGLLVHIYSKPDLLSVSGASKEIAALFLLHGRTGSADDPYIGGTAQSAFDRAEQHPGQQRDFIVIAFVSPLPSHSRPSPRASSVVRYICLLT